MKNRKFIVDDDNGQIMSTIVRSFLLGSAYIFRHKQMQNEHRKHLSARTDKVISRAKRQWSSDFDHFHPGLSQSPTFASALSDSQLPSSPDGSMLLSPGGTSRRHVVNHSDKEIRDALHVARHDHMSDADCIVSVSLGWLSLGVDHSSSSRTGRVYERRSSSPSMA